VSVTAQSPASGPRPQQCPLSAPTPPAAVSSTSPESHSTNSADKMNPLTPLFPANVHQDRGNLSEEQRKRIEANRLAALQRRNAAAWYQASGNPLGSRVPVQTDPVHTLVRGPIGVAEHASCQASTAQAKGSITAPVWTTEGIAEAGPQAKAGPLERISAVGVLQGGLVRGGINVGQVGSFGQPVAVGPPAHSSVGSLHGLRHVPPAAPMSGLLSAVTTSLPACHTSASRLKHLVDSCSKPPVRVHREDGRAADTEPVLDKDSSANAEGKLFVQSAEFEVPDDFWDDLDVEQLSKPGGCSGAELGKSHQDVARGLLINSATTQGVACVNGDGSYSVQSGMRSQQPCTGAHSHEPVQNSAPSLLRRLPAYLSPEPQNVSVQPQGPLLVPRPLEVLLELHNVDLFSVSVQWAFCDPPPGSAFAPDTFKDPEGRTRSVLERACPDVSPRGWVFSGGQDGDGFLVFSMLNYDKVSRALLKLQDAKVAAIPDPTFRALRARWGLAPPIAKRPSVPPTNEVPKPAEAGKGLSIGVILGQSDGSGKGVTSESGCASTAAEPLKNSPKKNGAAKPESDLKSNKLGLGKPTTTVAHPDSFPGPSNPPRDQSPLPPIGRPCESSWRPLRTGHIGDDEVDALMEQGLPRGLRRALLPFQWEGVRYGLRRGGRCLIADEMGVGKTIQVGGDISVPG
jgi:hypothetical protein